MRKLLPFSAQNIQNMQTSQGYIFRILQHFITKFCNNILLILVSSLREFFFCLDQKLV
jgi:hypothetical protein